LEGIVALTLHTASRSLMIAVERGTGAQTVDTLREALRDRRRQLKAEARQLRRAAEENAALRAGTTPSPPTDLSA
jgi:hypothetical protein